MKLELPDDLGRHQGEHVGKSRDGVAGPGVLTDGGAAEDAPALQDDGLQPGAAEIRGRRQAIVPATDDDRVVFSRHPPEYSRGRIRQLSLDNGSPQVQISPQALPNSQTRDKGGVSIGGIRDVG